MLILQILQVAWFRDDFRMLGGTMTLEKEGDTVNVDVVQL